MIPLDIINTAKLFKTRISDTARIAPSCTTWLPSGYVMECHGMATAISRRAVMVMKCEGETVWTKQVSTDNTAVN